MKPRKGRRTVVRCQYCGKNLWPLRGLFDEDFCSRDHRQRYHERVRKALEHLPKAAVAPRAKGIAGFQFEKPRLQEPALPLRQASELRANVSAPTVPDFARADVSPSLTAGSFSLAAPVPATGSQRPVAHASAPVVSPGVMSSAVMSIDTVRDRFQGNTSGAAVAIMDKPAGISLEPGNMAFKVSQRGVSLEAFDELNHVYLHEPEPILETSLPRSGGIIGALQPIAITARIKHHAAAGPSGSGRVEFFPMQPRMGSELLSPEAEEGMREQARQAGDDIWLEDIASWRVPVSLAPNRSSMAMLPAADRLGALERFRNSQPASAANTTPVEWQFQATAAERRPFQAAGPEVASAMLIEFPAPGDRAVGPLSDDVAVFDAAVFNLHLPSISVDLGEMDMLTPDAAAVEPESAESAGPAADVSATTFPQIQNWMPIEAHAVLPVRSPEMRGALAEPKIDAGKPLPSTMPGHNGAANLKSKWSLSIPDRPVRLKQGPEFFAAEPVMADSVARPVAARPYAVIELSLPAVQLAGSDSPLQSALSSRLMPLGFAGEAVLGEGATAIGTASVEIPSIEPQPAGFGTGELKKMEAWHRDNSERVPHHFGWMTPQLTLHVPEFDYRELPLALKVDVPEPRTVTVFETATFDNQSNVLSINEAKPSKHFGVPSYIKGMAAGLMLASVLWFGSSSIKSGGLTLRPGDLIRLTIQRRALYEVGDNFHAGLVNWDGKNFSKSWAYDKEGYIRPGRLAFYKPSRDMSDYRLEFLTQVERKSVGWVFRAADDQNYYAMKLAVTEPGPRPLVALVKYSVIDGKKESRGETPLQVMMHNNQPYRVQVDVKGNTFVTSIEGQAVDS